MTVSVPHDNKKKGRVIPLPLGEELQKSYLDYAMSVIVGRALPDVRDGLKPVQRRILYAMRELSLWSNGPHKKSARIVGETMGKYHPHGDAAIYDAMVRMAQDFSMRYPLVDGQGNFGSLDGDPAAAQRYTEAKLTRFGEALLKDIDEDTVDWTSNFDDSLEEPTVLPSFLPNLLVNGSSGIAVGMATNIPPHNLAEVARALLFLIDRGEEECSLDDLMAKLPGPDFPTGGIIIGDEGIRQAYATGKGKITLRGKAEIEVSSRGKSLIIVTEIPYGVNKAALVESIASLVKTGKIDGIGDLRDESNREGIRLIIEVQKGYDPDIILRQIYAHTNLQVTFGINNLALTPKGEPKNFSVLEILQSFIEHRKDVVTRRTKHRLKKAREQEHYLEGLLIALDRIDEVVAIIRKAKDKDGARKTLMSTLDITDIQAQGILDMRLQQLTSLEGDKIRKTLAGLKKDIDFYIKILEQSAVLMRVIREEIASLEDIESPRRTVILKDVEDIKIEKDDLIPEAPVFISLFGDGTVKRVDAKFVSNGKVVEMAEEAGGWAETLKTTNKREVLFVSRDGNTSWENAKDVPDIRDRRAIAKTDYSNGNIRVAGVVEIPEDGQGYIMIVTSSGMAKRMSINEARGSTRMWKKAINLADGDAIVSVIFVPDEETEILFVSSSGKVLKTTASQFRPQGRNAGGVRAMKLGKKDQIVSAATGSSPHLCLCSEYMFIKKVSVDDIPQYNRGGGGIRCFSVNSKSGPVVGGVTIDKEDSVILGTASSEAVKIPSKSIPLLSRTKAGRIPEEVPVPNKAVTLRRNVTTINQGDD